MILITWLLLLIPKWIKVWYSDYLSDSDLYRIKSSNPTVDYHSSILLKVKYRGFEKQTFTYSVFRWSPIEWSRPFD